MTAAPPASAVQFTTHELLALLALNRGPSEEASRSMLKLADLPDTSELVRAGFSTLSVRELLDRKGDEVTPRGPARALARILTSATLWIDATVAVARQTSVTFLVESPAGKAALFARPGSIVLCVPLEASVDCSQMALELASAGFSSGGQDTLVSLRRRTSDVPSRTANVRRTAERGWEVARTPAGGDDLEVMPYADEAHAFRALRAALGLPARADG